MSGSLVSRIHLIRWISGVSEVRTPTPAYNNALSYQLSYAHRTTYLFIRFKVWIMFMLYASLICSNLFIHLLFIYMTRTILIYIAWNPTHKLVVGLLLLWTSLVTRAKHGEIQIFFIKCLDFIVEAKIPLKLFLNDKQTLVLKLRL